ncbi:plant glycogenin-like starch initiation protein 6 [Wolffia australiana]
MMKLRECGLGCLFLLLTLLGTGITARTSASEEAFVSLLYGDEFLLGVRVLGKSIRDTGTTKDMVVLVSDGVSNYAKRLLQADGWIVKEISLLVNPNLKRPKRFWGVYTKLKIFNLIMYKKVVYLDADTIVVKSIDDLFKCGKFCANLKHSERLNSGVMVVEPSEAVFKDMMDKVAFLPSYTGGDQGFLNSYFQDFPNAHLFEPNLTSELRNSRPVPEMERLSTLYNADVGLYMLANKWMVDERELKVIHYTLGPLKPWDWWTSWLLKPVDVWQNVREKLEETLPGTAGGSSYEEQLVVKILCFIPLCALFFFVYRFRIQMKDAIQGSRHLVWDYIRRINLQGYNSVTSSSMLSTSTHLRIPAYLGVLSIFICFLAVALSLGLAFVLIPHQVKPWTGLLLMYEWTFLWFFLFFGGFLWVVEGWGRAAGIQLAAASASSRSQTDAYDSPKGHQRQPFRFDQGTLFYGLGTAFLAIVAPSLPSIFGISALIPRLGLMVGGGIILASFMTHASEQLALKAFARGMEEQGMRTLREGNIRGMQGINREEQTLISN